MHDAVEPLNFLAGTEALSSIRGDWKLDEWPAQEPSRSFRTRVAFSRPFLRIPLVHLGIVGFDVSNHDAARLTAVAENVTSEGFDIVLSTWLHSRLWRVDVSWLAVGA